MPLSAFQQFCADTGCPDNVHTLALWTQRNDAVAERDRERKLNESLTEAYEKVNFELGRAESERDKLKAEREQMEKQEPFYGNVDVDWLYSVLRFADKNPSSFPERDDTKWYLDGSDAYEIVKLYAHPPVPDGKVLVHDGVGGAPEHFRDWFTMNIPDGTVIGNSHWWVNRVYNAMLKAAQQGE